MYLEKNLGLSIAAAALLTSVLGSAAFAASSPAPTAYYVSPTGSDSNAGTTLAKPFATLEKARAAMVKTKTQTLYLMGGVYPRSATMNLSKDDAGATWRNYPHQKPILDGMGKVGVGLYLSGANNVTVYGLTFQNFTQTALQSHNVSGVTFQDNTVLNTASTGWVQGGILAMGTFLNGKITHNLVQNSGYAGIWLGESDPTDTINGAQVTNNTVVNSCLTVADCGAIYVEETSHIANSIVVANNLVYNFGSKNSNSRGIYLDNTVSNVSVTGNIIYGGGMYGFHINGGHSNKIADNIFDITNTKALALYQKWNADTMANNSFSCNIVTSYAAPPVALWDNIGTGIIPTDTSNLYWSPSGALPNIGIKDSSPHYANPAFISPTGGQYTFSRGNPAGYCNFPTIQMSVFGPEPNI